jgi:hypothetical protein
VLNNENEDGDEYDNEGTLLNLLLVLVLLLVLEIGIFKTATCFLFRGGVDENTDMPWR